MAASDFVVGIPARLSLAEGGDPRVGAANQLFDDIVELARESGVTVRIIEGRGEQLADLDGVILPGGGDLDPALYGGDQIGALYDVNPEQDALDLEVLRFAEDARLPVLGICRGAQLLNVHRGGTLIEDLPVTSVAHRAGPDSDGIFSRHPVALAGLLRDAYGTDEVHTSSGHHQGIGQVGAGLDVLATADDGLVEAIGDTSDGAWIVAVQWHPEAREEVPAARALPFALLRDELTRRSAAAA